jgi:hypothetical protein
MNKKQKDNDRFFLGKRGQELLQMKYILWKIRKKYAHYWSNGVDGVKDILKKNKIPLHTEGCEQCIRALGILKPLYKMAGYHGTDKKESVDQQIDALISRLEVMAEDKQVITKLENSCHEQEDQIVSYIKNIQ